MDVALPCARIYTDADGGSRIEDVTLSLSSRLLAPPADPLPMLSLTSVLGATADAMLVHGDSDWGGEQPHPAPTKLLWAMLAGECEVTVSDGTSRRFVAGELFIVEDTSGVGHSSKLLTDGSLALVLRFAS